MTIWTYFSKRFLFHFSHFSFFLDAMCVGNNLAYVAFECMLNLYISYLNFV